MMSYADRRREAARKGMAKLREARKKEIKALTSQVQNLQVALDHLKAHPEEQHQSIQPFAYARRVLDQHHDDALREQVVIRNRLIQSERIAKKKRIDNHKAVVLAAQAHILRTEGINMELLTRLTGQQQLKDFLEDWLMSHLKGRPLLMETILLPDDNGRRNGCYFMTNRAYNLSKQKYPPRKTYEEEVEDFLEVKIHLDEDDRETCIYAIESHVPFTVDANFENVAKTWWFDLVESNPLVEAFWKDSRITSCTSSMSIPVISTDGCVLLVSFWIMTKIALRSLKRELQSTSIFHLCKARAGRMDCLSTRDGPLDDCALDRCEFLSYECQWTPFVA
ncbi:hypothetical protein Ae201684P_010517 [Aphanomyces euteiches]|nr:hypothetical protein Ae201684P_010517 [Aphanomyces euteiches]